MKIAWAPCQQERACSRWPSASWILDVPELPQRLGLPAPVSDVRVDAQAPLIELHGGAVVPGAVVHLTQVGEGHRLAQRILDPIADPQALLEAVDRLVERPWSP